jgi:hypothetical protein
MWDGEVHIPQLVRGGPSPPADALCPCSMWLQMVEHIEDFPWLDAGGPTPSHLKIIPASATEHIYSILDFNHLNPVTILVF